MSTYKLHKSIDEQLKTRTWEELILGQKDPEHMYPVNIHGGKSMAFLPLYDDTGHYPCSYDVLYVNISRELYEAIEEVESEKGMTLPGEFESYVGGSEEGYAPAWGESKNDQWYGPRTCVLVKDLKSFSGHPGMTQSYKNFAVWSYLDHCPDNLKVALYWH